MRKLFIFVSFFLMSGALQGWAAPWGTIPDFEVPTMPEEQRENSVGEGYVLRPLLQAGALKVSLWIENERNGEFEKFSHLIVRSYQNWFDNAAKRIIKEKREQEFADVLPYLQRRLSIEVVREEEADIKVNVYATRKNMRKDLYQEEWKKFPHLFGVYGHSKKLIALSKQHFMRSPKEVLLHEVGHSLGFSDQYYSARWRTDEVYSSYSSNDSVMNGELTKLTCDDADGLINLIDRVLALERGGEKGWKSLCGFSLESYKNGMPSQTNRYRVDHRDDGSLVIEEYEKGKRISVVQLRFAEEDSDPFAIVEEEKVLKRNSGGYPALVQGKNGEEIYYIRAHTRFEKIITKDGKLIAHMYTFPVELHIGVLKKFRYKGEIGSLEGEINSNFEPLGAVFKLPNKQVKAIVNLAGKRNKREYETIWFGPWEEVFSSKNNTDVFDTSKVEQAIFEQGFVEWAKIWPQYIHSNK